MSQKVLIVEDDTMIQGFLRLALEGEGYQVNVVRTANEMRVAFQQGGYDLILLDLGLPDADGLDVISEIRAASSVPIVVASARQGSSDRVAALERGADDYLTKPFDPAELLVRVKNLFSRCNAHPVSAAPPGGVPNMDAKVKPPIPPAMKTTPVSPVPASVHPVETKQEPHQTSVEASLQAAAKKSAPTPVSHAPAKGNVDISVLIAAFVAVIAFGGVGFYWFTTSMTTTNDNRIAALERQLSSQNPTDEAQVDGGARRGALQPPAEPEVPIAQSTAERSADLPSSAQDQLSQSVTSSSSRNSVAPAEPIENAPVSNDVVAAPRLNEPKAKSTDWALNSVCPPLPDVKWWRVKTHMQIVLFVNREHDGDWQPYLNNWRARIEKLKDIMDRGSGIKTSSGEILQGESLANYIRDTANRIAIIQCLSREARIASER